MLWINALGTGLVGMWLTGQPLDLRAHPILLWLTLPFNPLIYGINDIFDQDTDARNRGRGRSRVRARQETRLTAS